MAEAEAQDVYRLFPGCPSGEYFLRVKFEVFADGKKARTRVLRVTARTGFGAGRSFEERPPGKIKSAAKNLPDILDSRRDTELEELERDDLKPSDRKEAENKLEEIKKQLAEEPKSRRAIERLCGAEGSPLLGRVFVKHEREGKTYEEVLVQFGKGH